MFVSLVIVVRKWRDLVDCLFAVLLSDALFRGMRLRAFLEYKSFYFYNLTWLAYSLVSSLLYRKNVYTMTLAAR